MLDFKIRYTSSYGEIAVIINGVRYTYYLDAGFIPKIIRLSRHRPGEALAFLKKVASSYEKGGDKDG